MSGAFKPTELLAVELDFGEKIRVGRLALVDREILFEFDPSFPVERWNISPFILKRPLDGGVIPGPSEGFEGLHGVFNDSLPDGWGRLLMDRKLRDVGIRPDRVTPLDRLAWIGSRGMGALCYRPEHPRLVDPDGRLLDLDELAKASKAVLQDSPEAVFDQLLQVGGSPAGARPKALIGLSAAGDSVIHGEDILPRGYDHWLVKFEAKNDVSETGLIEQAYAEMARLAGVDMPETRVLPSRTGPGFFAIKRFDRDGNKRMHMHTVCGLLHADFKLPSIGYEELLKATLMLTRNQVDVDQMFCRMVFNVYAHNRDDHTKNHSFLMNHEGEWRLSPAYDIIFSDGPGGEHTLDVAGEGRNPGIEEIRKVGNVVGLSKGKITACVDRVRAAVAEWPEIARGNGVSKKFMSEINIVIADL